MPAFRFWRIFTTDVQAAFKSVQLAEVQWRTVAGGAATAPTAVTGDHTSSGTPSNLVDGSFSTFWTTDGTVPAGLYFDFGADIAFTEVAIATRLANAPQGPKAFTIDGSEDNATWTNVATFTGQNEYADNVFITYSLIPPAGNEISKAGAAAVIRMPPGNLISSAGVIATIRPPAGDLIAKAGVVAVIRQKVLVDSHRRRQGMIPLF